MKPSDVERKYYEHFAGWRLIRINPWRAGRGLSADRMASG